METFKCSGENLPNSLCQLLEAQASFASNFVSILNATKHNSSVLFLAKTLHTLVKSSPLKCKFLKLLSSQSKFVKFFMSILKLQVNSSSDFSSFFSVITYNSSVSLQFIHFLLWAKGSHENNNFDTFKCSDENFPNSSCHFPNHKSVFFFFYQGFLSRTLTTHRTAGEGRGSSFIPLYHSHPLTNIQTFICNFACEITITYF